MVVSVLLVLFGMSMLFVSSTSRVEAYIKILSMQGFLLFCLVIAESSKMHLASTIFLSIETLGLKAILLPAFLFWIVKRNGIKRELDPSVPNFYSLVIVTCIFTFGFLIPLWAGDKSADINPVYFGISISTILTGLFVIITRKRMIVHVLGYMMIENGIFLLSLSITKEMPLVVNAGVLLDVFILIFVLGLFINRIQDVFEDAHIEHLSDLKD